MLPDWKSRMLRAERMPFLLGVLFNRDQLGLSVSREFGLAESLRKRWLQAETGGRVDRGPRTIISGMWDGDVDRFVRSW